MGTINSDSKENQNGLPDGCPVKKSISSDISSSSSSFWSSLFNTSSRSTSSDKGSPISSSSISSSPTECPVSSTTNVVPASLEETARYAQTPQTDQHIRLGTERQLSSIPRVAAATAVSTNDDKLDGDYIENNNIPHHQHDIKTTNWVYPSEQQFYNAMRRKGWQNIPEETVPTVVQIHNNINERTWKQIQQWENTDNIYLQRFQGRPKDLSPKAFFLSYVFRIYDKPFDRHDWYVQHSNNSEQQVQKEPQRYVIDYYYLPPSDPNVPLPIPYVDVRPAIDNPRAVYLRMKRFLEDAFPGISTHFKERQAK